MNDPWSLVVSALGGLSLLLLMAGAVVAFVRLKSTPAGLLIGGGLAAMTLCGCIGKAHYWLYVRPALEGGDYESLDAILAQSSVFNGVQSCVSVLLWGLVAIGLFMLPKSLAKLSSRAG